MGAMRNIPGNKRKQTANEYAREVLDDEINDITYGADTLEARRRGAPMYGTSNSMSGDMTKSSLLGIGMMRGIGKLLSRGKASMFSPFGRIEKGQLAYGLAKDAIDSYSGTLAKNRVRNAAQEIENAKPKIDAAKAKNAALQAAKKKKSRG